MLLTSAVSRQIFAMLVVGMSSRRTAGGAVDDLERASCSICDRLGEWSQEFSVRVESSGFEEVERM